MLSFTIDVIFIYIKIFIVILEKSIEQWERKQKILNELEIKLCFVSPLRRTLQTAYLMLYNHPNFENIKFVIVPMMKEHIEACDDLASGLDDTLNFIKDNFPK